MQITRSPQPVYNREICQGELVTNTGDDKKITEVWDALIKCVNNLLELAKKLSTVMIESKVGNTKYLKSFVGIYSELLYLQGTKLNNLLKYEHEDQSIRLADDVEKAKKTLVQLQPWTLFYTGRNEVAGENILEAGKYGQQKDEGGVGSIAENTGQHERVQADMKDDVKQRAEWAEQKKTYDEWEAKQKAAAEEYAKRHKQVTELVQQSLPPLPAPGDPVEAAKLAAAQNQAQAGAAYGAAPADAG